MACQRGAKLQSFWTPHRGGTSHWEVQTPQDHWQGELRQGQAGQTHPNGQGGRYQDH